MSAVSRLNIVPARVSDAGLVSRGGLVPVESLGAASVFRLDIRFADDSVVSSVMDSADDLLCAVRDNMSDNVVLSLGGDHEPISLEGLVGRLCDAGADMRKCGVPHISRTRPARVEGSS